MFFASPVKYDEVLDCVDNKVMNDENVALLLPFSKDEFKEAIV